MHTRIRTLTNTVVVNLVAFLTIPMAVVYTVNAIDNRSTPAQLEERSAAASVAATVVNTKPAHHQAIFELNGEVRPAHELDLVAGVSGRVRELSPQFRSGRKIAKGTVLVHLDETEYRAAVASAHQELEEAKVSLLDEQRQSKLAKEVWVRKRGTERQPKSPLVLRGPQKASARARVAAAEANLAHAEARLANTQVVTPFDSVVVNRTVSPGAYVTPGFGIGKLYAVDYAEIRLTLTANQWKVLPKVDKMEGALIRHADSPNFQWAGRVVHPPHLVDPVTRMRELVVQIARPLDQSPPLLPGSFVSVQLRGRLIPDLLEVPTTALTADGFIWHVTAERRLERFSAVPKFSIGPSLFVPAPPGSAFVAVVQNPLVSYQPGTKVVTRPKQASP